MLRRLSSRERDSHIFKRDPFDWYVEDEWCSRRLFAEYSFHGLIEDPCCGTGRIVKAAIAAGLPACGQDIVFRPELKLPRYSKRFLWEADFLKRRHRGQNFVFNPPFKFAQEFIEHAIELADGRVFVFLDVGYIASQKRARWLRSLPWSHLIICTPRPWVSHGVKVIKGDPLKKGWTNYAWFGFDRNSRLAGMPSVDLLLRDG